MRFYLSSGVCLIVAAVCLFLLLPSGVEAQQGGSSASVSRGRSASTANPATAGTVIVQPGPYNSSTYYVAETPRPAFVPPDEVAVEEFINYHKHRLPLPRANQAVALDLRWGNDEVSARQPDSILQIGFTTPEVTERTDLRPLNLNLVIDRSGSMADADKMSRVKQALITMLDQLRPADIISIVIFDTYAQVLQPARTVGDGFELKHVINSIQPGGSTNINDGLMLGYKEALKNYQRSATNRVILLTDGIANQGVTNPQQIAQSSLEYNRRGIDLSTIGVGRDLDNNLLRTLARSGRGLYHFVADNEDIEKVFVNEIQSLISPVARRAELQIDYDADLQLEKIYGYNPRFRKNGVNISLDDMNSGLTAVVMVKFRSNNAFTNDRVRNVSVRLVYYDVKRQKNVEEAQMIALNQTNRRTENMLADVEVKKNYTIALLAQGLADMRAAYLRGNVRQAQMLVNTAVDTAYRHYQSMEDPDIVRILDIVEGYQTNLNGYNQQYGR